MGVKITPRDMKYSAEKAGRISVSNNIPRTGNEKRQEEWINARAQACRLILSNTDIVIYYSFLASNALRVRVKEWHGLMCEAIVLSESITRLVPKGRDSSALAKSANSSLVAELRRANVTGDLRPLREKVAEYLSPVISDRLTSSGIERGPESYKYFRSIVGETLIVAEDVYGRIDTLNSASGLLGETLSPGAVAPLARKIYSVLSESKSADLGATRVLDIATASASIDAFSRPIRVEYKVHTGHDFPTPLTLRLQVGESSIEFLNSDGSPTRLAMMSVSIGDIVSSPAGMRSEIIDISDNVVVLSEEIEKIPAAIVIKSPAQEYYRGLFTILGSAPTFGDSTIAGIYKRPVLRAMTRPEAAKYAAEFSTIAAKISPLTSESSLSLQRLGLDVPTTEAGGMVTALEEYSPPVSRTTKLVGEKILDMMGNKGFDLVERDLLRGSVNRLRGDDYLEAATIGMVELAVGDFSSIFPQRPI
jgi:hypothetical protein